MSQTTEDEWYHVDAAGVQHGPIGFESLKTAARNGQVRRESLVWRDGMASWTSAAIAAPGLFEGMAMPPPLPPRIAQPMYAPPPAIGENAGVRMLIPVGRSGWAIAAGYLGLMSLIPIFAPAALIVGFIALRDLKRHPESHGAGRAWFGVIMGILFTGLLAFGIVALIIEGVR